MDCICNERETPLEGKLKFVGTALKEMRINDGKRQIDYHDEGVSRRQIQRAEAGGNITLKKLLWLLDFYGYSLSDVDLENYN